MFPEINHPALGGTPFMETTKPRPKAPSSSSCCAGTPAWARRGLCCSPRSPEEHTISSSLEVARNCSWDDGKRWEHIWESWNPETPTKRVKTHGNLIQTCLIVAGKNLLWRFKNNLQKLEDYSRNELDGLHMGFWKPKGLLGHFRNRKWLRTHSRHSPCKITNSMCNWV